MRSSFFAALGALSSFSLATAKPISSRDNNQTEVYDFALLTPSTKLQWTPCFGGFTCTRLLVPLDYTDNSAGTVDIAFIKWTAPNATAATQDILVNPGGPGGSGVQLVQQALSGLQQHLGTANNLVGFDPRGVNNSGPDLSCFPGKKNTVPLYDPDWLKAVDVNSSAALADKWAEGGAWGDWCSDVHGPESVSRYVNTVSTATDMLHYAELAIEEKGQSKNDAKLWYYGASYGTVLGSTFAALFPGRVGRVILDGVVDGEDYYQGKWHANLPDADAAIATFFKYCYEGGKDACALWDESPEAIEARFNAVVDDITASPVTVTDRYWVETPVALTILDLTTVIVQVPYSPIATFPLLAEVIAGLEQRNGTLLATLVGEVVSLDHCTAQDVEPRQLEPQRFIACNDANARFNLSTLEAWNEHVDFLADQSRWLGSSWASLSLYCRSLAVSNNVPESQQFTGPPSANNTSNPVLFLSNLLDPVTPLRAAKKMHGLFCGSGLLVQNGVGHATISETSACTAAVIQKYLVDGTVPDDGTVCETDEIPFKTPVGESKKREVVKAMKKRHII